jgi:hypothetical protein
LIITETLFDNQVGLQENRKKRQRWSGEDTCEHLGLQTAPGAQEGSSSVLPRDGWQGIRAVALRLPLVPGPMATREAVVWACLLPKVRWAAPLVTLPPLSLDKVVMQGIVRSKSTFWCIGRFWADNILACPTFATALQALKSATLLADSGAPALRHSLDKHAELLQLRVVHLAETHVWVTPRTMAEDRVKEIAQAASFQSDVPLELRRKYADVFDACSAAGRHASRAIARICSLRRQIKAKNPRYDSAGLEDVDIEVLSAPAWKKWKAGLRPPELGALRFWRGGAITSPTRLAFVQDPTCPFCGEEWASARHLWASCPHFDLKRRQLQEQAGFDDGWWDRQPACTAKSGWITFDAARTHDLRVEVAIAANQLGIEVVTQLLSSRPRRHAA